MTHRSITAPEPSNELTSITGTTWWTCRDVARHLQISPREAHRLAKAGHIPAHAIPGMRRQSLRFRPDEVAAAMQPTA